MGREENVIVFMDTEKQVKSNSKLKDAVDNSSANQKLILETKYLYQIRIDIKILRRLSYQRKGHWKLHQYIMA